MSGLKAGFAGHGSHRPGFQCLECERDARPTATWPELRDEVRAFETWYGERMGVNAWVGVNTLNGASFYGGWSVEGDALYYEWDESVMTTAEGESPEEVIADLIRIARSYRARIDEEREADSPLGHGTPVPEEATLPSGDARVAAG